jgi:hypothetical protein
MERWWQEDERHPKGLSAVALVAALLTAGEERDDVPICRPRILPAALGGASANAFTGRLPAPHRRPEQSASAPAVGTGRLPIAFLYAEKYARSASTFLRGQQLAELVTARHPDRLETLTVLSTPHPFAFAAALGDPESEQSTMSPIESSATPIPDACFGLAPYTTRDTDS